VQPQRRKPRLAGLHPPYGPPTGIGSNRSIGPPLIRRDAFERPAGSSPSTPSTARDWSCATCEELSNAEAARVLGLERTAASHRYIRAFKRLKAALGGSADLFDA